MRELVRGSQKVLLCLVRVPFWCLPVVLLLVTGCASTKRHATPINQPAAIQPAAIQPGALTQAVGTAKLLNSISRNSH